MTEQRKTGFIILDRKGEYVTDTLDQRGNKVFGLQHHPAAARRMVVVSMRDEFAQARQNGVIHAHLRPRFSIRDIDPIDLADFLPSLTRQQADLLRDYAHVDGFYDKLLAETQFGAVDNRHWYEHFQGLFDLNAKAKTIIKEAEDMAKKENRDELTEDERAKLQGELGGTNAAVLGRAAGRIKRFCLNPFFGGSAKGRDILAMESCVDAILDHLAAGRVVFVDMRGQADENYILVAALFARRLLTANKLRDDGDQIRACIVMEEAHNILSETEVGKGDGRGSIFIELAREGRSFKLGFILVTQQPDARSIAPQVVKTIDTVVAFNMPPDDAKHLQRLKSSFTGLESQISNADEFQGVAIADAGPVFFEAGPVDPGYMQACAKGTLPALITGRVTSEPDAGVEPPRAAPPLNIEDRLALLSRQRRESIHPVALTTMQIWRSEVPVEQEEESSEYSPGQ